MRIVCCLALVCLATAARAAEPEKVALAYKPTATAVTYWVRNSDRTTTFKAKQGPVTHTTNSLGLVHHAVKDENGKLSVALSTEVRSLMMESQIVDTQGKTPRETFTYVMSTRGELADPAKAAELAALVSPVFPAEPIAVGHTWKVAVPATKKWRLPFEVSHTFESIKDVKGVKLAVIRTKARAKGRDEKSKAKVAIDIDGTSMFDIAAGAWAKSRTMTTSSVRFDAPQKNGTTMLMKGVLRVVSRREPGETKPPAEK